MKLIKCEKTAVNTVELEFFIEASTIKDAVSKVFRQQAKKYNVPGFRKGKAPRNLIEKMYGEDVFLYDAVNEVFPEEYKAALEEAKLEPVGQPNADLVEASKENGATLKVTVVVKPEITLGNYIGLAASKTVNIVDEKRVDEELERLRQRNARIITREGAAENGDISYIDYEGFLDGVAFDGGKEQGRKLELGSGEFIPGFEEQIVGHSAGEEFDVSLTFPEEYHAQELAGQDVVFKVKLNEVQQRELPALDDEFAKDASEFDSLDEFKNSIRADMQKELDQQADLEAENQLVEQIVATIEGEIPSEMYETRIDEMVRDFAFRLEQQGMNLPTYMQYSGMDEEAFRNGYRESAEKQVKIRLALETIVKLESIVATDEDIETEVERIAQKYSMEKEQVKKLMPMEEIAKDLAVNKAIDFVKSKATITEKAPEEKTEEVPEKPADEEDAPKAKKPKATKTKKSKENDDNLDT